MTVPRLFAAALLLVATAAIFPAQAQDKEEAKEKPTLYTLGRASGRLEAAIMEVDASFRLIAKSKDEKDQARIVRWNKRKDEFKKRLSGVEADLEKGGSLAAAKKKLDTLAEDIGDWQVNSPVAQAQGTKAGAPLMFLPGFGDYDLYGPYGWGGPIVVVNPVEVLKMVPDAVKDLKGALMEFRRQQLGENDPVYKRWLEEQKKKK